MFVSAKSMNNIVFCFLLQSVYGDIFLYLAQLGYLKCSHSIVCKLLGVPTETNFNFFSQFFLVTDERGHFTLL